LKIEDYSCEATFLAELSGLPIENQRDTGIVSRWSRWQNSLPSIWKC